MRHLRLVRTLAAEGTLTAAGKKLFLSQSAHSHQLREIEDEPGVQLFQRATKRMVLTAAGQRLLSSADVVLEKIEFNRKVLVPAGVEPASLTRVPTTDAIVELVKAGIGVAVLNLWSIQPHLESKDLPTVPLEKNGFGRSWYAAVDDDHRQPPSIAQIIGFLANSHN